MMLWINQKISYLILITMETLVDIMWCLRPEVRNVASYDHGLVFIIPTGFYPISPAENLYGFGMSPTDAREILKNKGFVEDLDLI